MYRTLILVALYAITVAAAPQESRSGDITYVKMQPLTDNAPQRKDSARGSRIENLPLTIGNQNPDRLSNPSEIDGNLPDNDGSSKNAGSTGKFVRQVSIDDSDDYESDTAEPTEAVTEVAEEIRTRTRAPSPRLLSKLSYIEKNDIGSSVATNFVERTGKRGTFISKCKCAKDWNCPKLQITTPRCPNEYFLCC